jgi:hypothetical protein
MLGYEYNLGNGCMLVFVGVNTFLSLSAKELIITLTKLPLQALGLSSPHLMGVDPISGF